MDNTIALQVKAPDPMRSIGSMLDVARGAQALQSSRQEFESKNIDLQKQRQGNDERVATQQFMSDPANWQDDKGNIDMGKINANLAKIAPMTGADTISKLSTLSTAQSTANQAKQGLTQSQRGIIGGVIGLLGRRGEQDPGVYVQELDGLKAHFPGDKNFASLIDSYKTTLGMSPAGPNVPKVAITAAQGYLSPQEQQTALSPQVGLTNTGGTINQTTTTPAIGGNAPSVAIAAQGTPVTMSPGAVETTEVGPDGNAYIVSKSPTGAILSTRPLAGGAGGGTGGGPAMPHFAPGDKEAVPALEAERSAARNFLQAAPISHQTNRGILEEIDKTTTGALGPTLQKIASTLGVKFDTAEGRASAYDLVGKYLERNAIEAAKAMGPNTNAGLESAIKANGSVAYNPTAIKKLTKLNDAIVSGAEMYQPGLEKAIAAAPSRGVLAKREFDQAWGQNFDPRIMMIDQASKAGDKKAIEEIKKQLGAAGVQELVRKAAALDRLSQQGHL